MKKLGSGLAFGVCAAMLALLWPRAGQAHFILKSPENWREQNGLGDPQKTGPCGEGGSAAPTGVVTQFQEGQTITITIDEVIFHPGHYRVALAVQDRSELPAPPAVTPDSSSECGSAEIQDPPVFPILADGLLEHSSEFNGEQTMQVKLPDGVTCDKCTLQIIEFMSAHSAPCFYYHCADIAISPASLDGGAAGSGGNGGNGGNGGTTGSGGTTGTGGAAGAAAGAAGAAGTNSGDDSSSDEGCSCSLPGRNRGDDLAALAALAALAIARRRRPSRDGSECRT